MNVNSFQDRENVIPCQALAKHMPSDSQVIDRHWPSILYYKFYTRSIKANLEQLRVKLEWIRVNLEQIELNIV